MEVGAHIGFMTQIFEQSVGTSGLVIAIEPTPASLLLLEKNVLEGTEIVRKACSHEIGSACFYTEGYGGFTNTLNKRFSEEKAGGLARSQGFSTQIETLEISVTTLDKLFEDLPRQTVDFLKIDVEGSEKQVISGGDQLLRNTRFLMIEISRFSEGPEDILNSMGFVDITESVMSGSSSTVGHNRFYQNSSLSIP